MGISYPIWGDYMIFDIMKEIYFHKINLLKGLTGFSLIDVKEALAKSRGNVEKAKKYLKDSSILMSLK